MSNTIKLGSVVKAKGANNDGLIVTVRGQVHSVTTIRPGRVHVEIAAKGESVELFCNVADITVEV